MGACALVRLDPKTLSAWLAAGDTVVIDVRERTEFEREHIPGAVSIPLSALDASRLPREKRAVLCCAAGCRSQSAARRLGLQDLAHLEGGLAAWKEAGLPTVGTAAESTHTA